jgi:hypothetical protein
MISIHKEFACLRLTMHLHDCNVFHPDRKPVFMGGNRVTGAAKGDLNAVAPQATDKINAAAKNKP